ncbi:hypothetical protein GCM10023063_38670 [Arthrobacter methylotrophus]|uniref:PIN domain-containing protein n=1 Tax=Arthrobacter methylotrophus TaxID=121291 RepID=A0ABV5UTV9_9MICC
MFTALLDTCVLWPSLQRDFLLSLAVEGLYRPIWSSAILDELEYHEHKKRVQRGAASSVAAELASHLVGQMRKAFEGSEVVGWEGLDGKYGLPDPDDEHLVAASVVGGAGAIITENVKDLPADKIPEGIAVISPQAFAYQTVALDPARALSAVTAISSRSGRNGPVISIDSILDILTSRYGMDEAVEILRTI